MSAAAADDEDGDTASSISDVFTDMLNVNEDIIAATAECQAEGDIDGLIAYQCILHRDLMEMAEFIDSIFGVYGNIYTNSNSSTASSTLLPSDEAEPHMVDLTAEVAEDKAFAPAAETFPTVIKKKPARKNAQRGALLTAINAGMKVRETQRSKEQWIKYTLVLPWITAGAQCRFAIGTIGDLSRYSNMGSGIRGAYAASSVPLVCAEHNV